MSFWKKLWDRLNTDIQLDWNETIKGGVESADNIFKLAEVWNKKENASLADWVPYFQQTASLLDVLNSPLGQVIGASIPFIGIATGSLTFLIEKTKKELSIEDSIFIVAQGAYLESFKDFFTQHPEIESKVKETKVSEALSKQIQSFGENFALDQKEAENTLVCFAESQLAISANELLTARLEESGFTEIEAEIITQRIARNTYRYLKWAFVKNLEKMPKLAALYGQQWQAELKRDTSLDSYLKEIAKCSEEKVFDEDFSFKDIYVPLQVQAVKDGKIQDKETPQNIETWAINLLLDDDKKREVLFIQGRPGGGKSIFCRLFADKVRRELYPIYIPILIKLKDIEDFANDFDQTLTNVINQDFVTDRGWLTDQNTRFLFLLDGFDELVLTRGKGNTVKDFLDQVARFQGNCGSNLERQHRVLITGRPLALLGFERLMPSNLQWVNIALMDDETQTQWRSNWGTLVGETEAREFQNFLSDKSCPNQVQKLAREPLLLYLLAAMHRDEHLDLETLKSPDRDLVKVKIYRAVIAWVLTKQRDKGLNFDLTGFETEDLRSILAETGLCITQTGTEQALVSMIERRLVERGHKAAQKLIDEAKKNEETDPLKNALAAFYLKAATGQDNSVEFFHKSFGEFLTAERLAENFWLWTEKSTKRQINYTVKDTELNWEIYDLLGYGLLNPEILGYLMPLLKLGEPNSYLGNNTTFTATDWVSLFERLYTFYLRWSQGEFIEALESSSNILPLNKAVQLQSYKIPLGQRQTDVYTGLNILMLLLLISAHARSQPDLKEKINFYPCSHPDNAKEFDRERLLKIIRYSECLGAFPFWLFWMTLSNFNFDHFLRDVNLSFADLRNIDLNSANLRNINLSSANLSSANLNSTNFRHAICINADLSSADLRYAIFIKADLSNAYLYHADLRFANLRFANLRFAHLVDANLTLASLYKTNLADADLGNVILIDAELSGADLSNADLSSAILIGTDFSDADLSNANLKDIRWDQETNWQGVKGLDTAKNVPDALKQQLGLMNNK
ncbi:MAG: pentapeptide repeat-containing protein [Snowella sp.]|nr:pentapeptide repeat-containing protein [Snowella sp.]